MPCRKKSSQKGITVVATPEGALTPRGLIKNSHEAIKMGIPEAWAIREMLMAYAEGR